MLCCYLMKQKAAIKTTCETPCVCFSVYYKVREEEVRVDSTFCM